MEVAGLAFVLALKKINGLRLCTDLMNSKHVRFLRVASFNCKCIVGHVYANWDLTN